VSGQDRKFLPIPGTNQIAGFREFRPLTSQEKNKEYYVYIYIEDCTKLGETNYFFIQLSGLL